jgi:hypothetical protein
MVIRRTPLIAVLLVLSLSLTGLLPVALTTRAQEGPAPAVFGDPPRAALIAISEPDENGLVIIRGEPGAVFPGSVVAVRNMYTGQTVYPRAEITGAFVAEIYGPGNTPFWISPANRIETDERAVPGSLPGGPGVIVYGSLPRAFEPPDLLMPSESGVPETSIRIDGDAAEWPEVADSIPVDLGGGQQGVVYTIVNRQSVYLALVPGAEDGLLPADYVRLEVALELDGRQFVVQIDPRRGGGGRLAEIAADGTAQDLGPLGGLSAQVTEAGGAIELRFPRLAFTGWTAPVTVQTLRFVAPISDQPDAAADRQLDLFLLADERDQIDVQIVPSHRRMPAGATLFTLSGAVGGGSGTWQGYGRISDLAVQPGDELEVELTVIMQAPAMPGAGQAQLDAGLRLGAMLTLEPVAVNGAQTVADRATGNGWSGILTPTGLPVENVAGGLELGDATARNLAIEGDTLSFVLQWSLPVDESIPAGIYTPSLTGYAALAGLYNTWEDSGILGDGPGVGIPQTRLPLTLQVGEAAAQNRLVWTLFQDDPASSGARGVLAAEDAGTVALSSRVGFGGGAYVLPRVNPVDGEPIAYPLEPYIPAMLGNSFFDTVAPLVPFDFESGDLTVSVALPDGSVDDLGTVPLVQNMLSTDSRIESQAVGATSPVDVYRLTTLDPRLMAYTFQQDGLHTITLTGTIRDIWGNTYTGGGTYTVWLAEPFQMLPGVLPGTPFEVGDAYMPSLTVVPGFPADVALDLQVFPLDGSAPVQYTVSGQANAHGYFQPDLADPVWRFDTPGEYVVDITASYTDPDGRFWMSSVRGAGVIASPEHTLVARGGRGLANQPTDDRLAWYALDHALPEALQLNPDARMRWPYHSGDVLWARDQQGGLQAGLRVSDLTGAYAAWMVDRLPRWQADDGLTVRELANEEELPLITLGAPDVTYGPALAPDAIVNHAYAYHSAVRAGVALRQFVLGDETPGLIKPGWDFDDPFNYQPGRGINGDLPGDYTFLFGGVVIRNPELDLNEAAIYGSVALVIDPEGQEGSRVYPPLRGEAFGPDGGPLLTVDGDPLTMFFVSTGFQPGQVFTEGDVLRLAGQMAPALPGIVEADVTTPSGRILPIIGRANAVGYFFDPDQYIALSESGIWQIRLRVSYDGLTSAGQVYPPYPEGGVIGARDYTFAIYVLPQGADVVTLSSPQIADAYIPTALPFNLTAEVPPEWDDVQLNSTVLMNGIILDSGVQPALGDIFAYNYDPRRLNQVFPNLDLTIQDTFTPYSTDAVRITLVLSGLDENGDPVMAARTLVLFGDRLLTLYDGWPQE